MQFLLWERKLLPGLSMLLNGAPKKPGQTRSSEEAHRDPTERSMTPVLAPHFSFQIGRDILARVKKLVNMMLPGISSESQKRQRKARKQ